MNIKRLLYLFLAMVGYLDTASQNVTIGVASTIRAKLETQGGPSNVSGIFGTTNGISVGYNPALIGFNLYGNRYMGNGYAAGIMFDGTAESGMSFNFYPSGTTDATLGAATPVLKLLTSSGSKILTNATTAYTLDVGRGTGINGTAMFSGTTFNSHINYAGNEDTYIRAGKAGGRVYVNDTGGDVIIGSGTSIIGINYNNPVYTFEVRQTGGTGMQIGSNVTYYWEWRVAGSPANFYLRYGGAIHAYLRPSDGAIVAVSDGRLKNNIEETGPVLERLLALNPVTYIMREQNPLNIRSMGLIAQEVNALFPELAPQPTEKDKMMGVNYTSLAVIAVSGVQEEQKLLDRLELQITNAEKIAAKLEQKLMKNKY